MSLKIGAVPDKGRLKVRQSPTAHMCSIPCRNCFFANSGGGKTNLVVALLTNPKLFVGNVFDAVYVVSPSVQDDSTWAHLMKYRAKMPEIRRVIHGYVGCRTLPNLKPTLIGDCSYR